jgi:hypothetical protein
MTHPNDDKAVEPSIAPATEPTPPVFSDVPLAATSLGGVDPKPLDESDSYYAHAFAEDGTVEEPLNFWNNPDLATPAADLAPPAIEHFESLGQPAMPAPFVFEPTAAANAPQDDSHSQADTVDPELTAQVARAAQTKPIAPPAPIETIDPVEESDPVDEDDGDSFDDEALESAPPVAAGGGWTIPFLCADENRRLNYDRLQLRADLDHLRQQVRVNDEFISKVNDDPSLAERLAQRQMKQIRAGTKVLDLPQTGGNDMSPFQITAVQPPPPLPPYRSVGGHMAALCYDPRSRLYVMGAGLLMMAVGLVLGYSRV